VISLINSTKVSDLNNDINISAKISKGQFISLTDENGGPLYAVQSGFSNAAEKLGLVSDPDIEEENIYHSNDLNPENQTLNVFSVLTNLRNEFRKGDISESYISTQLGLLERVRDQFLTSRGEAGSRIARFDLLRTRFEEEQVFVQDLFSQKVDIDIISVTQKFLAQQQIYQSGLSAASRVLGTSLFNFL
jgi:flagellin-like hook-associated protein FlgL